MLHEVWDLDKTVYRKCIVALRTCSFLSFLLHALLYPRLCARNCLHNLCINAVTIDVLRWLQSLMKCAHVKGYLWYAPSQKEGTKTSLFVWQLTPVISMLLLVQNCGVNRIMHKPV